MLKNSLGYILNSNSATPHPHQVLFIMKYKLMQKSTLKVFSLLSYYIVKVYITTT